MRNENKRKLILSALFDVRPTNSDGDLDMSQIEKSRRILDLRGLKSKEEEIRRERALRLEALEQSKNWDFGSPGANQLVMDRLEADFGITGLSIEDLRDKVEKRKSVSVVQNKQPILVQNKQDNRNDQTKLTDLENDFSDSDQEESKNEIVSSISEEELTRMEEEFGDFEAPIVHEVAAEIVEEKNNSPIRLASEKLKNEAERLPTKEELLAELEAIEKNDGLGSILVRQQFVASGQDLADEEEKEKERPKQPDRLPIEGKNDLEKLYLQEDGFAALPNYSLGEGFQYYQVAHQAEEIEEEEAEGDEILTPLPGQMRPPVYAGPEWSQPAVSSNGVRSLVGFVLTGILVALIIPGATLLSRGLSIKNMVMGNGIAAVQNLLAAKKSIEETNWSAAEENFGRAHQNFIQAHDEINQLGQITLGILERLPGGSLVSSGSHLVKVGEHLAEAGQKLSSVADIFSADKWFGSLGLSESSVLAAGNSFTDLLNSSKKDLLSISEEIKLANKELSQVKINSLPENIQEQIAVLKDKLPTAESMLESALTYSNALLKILGQDNPKQYLLVFQNSGEMRATGGFIGTYGRLKVYQGQIKELLVDGVFNADGQLREKIIPPKPIQKISTAWSMHDANWFADFPTSADKIAWFYEKTGGPTVDGVISFTPTVIERLLELTGPVEMPEYNVVLNADNFVGLIQYKVEVDYDKELNSPKKILADFTPKFIEKLTDLSSQDQKKAAAILTNCLAEKHILIYFQDRDLENFVESEGWSGEIMPTDHDYVSVVSSNINGYKTDWVIKEAIKHQAEIQNDGSIIDTLTIVRRHEGGELEYDWWNRVNANYLRVYLPLGSQFISVEGPSKETYSPPIDYQANEFKEDAMVGLIEKNMIIDQKSGTEIFTESGKTVFGNWVYVSPGETVALTYKYKLPFKIDLTKSTDSYSLLAQKQSGSAGSVFSQTLKYPNSWQVSWQYPVDLRSGDGKIDYVGNLVKDRFLGMTFSF